MKLKYGLLAVIAATAIVTSCAEDDAPFSEVNTPTENNTTYARSRANGNQALQIANIFSGTRGFAEESTSFPKCAYHNNVMMITGLKNYNKIHK